MSLRPKNGMGFLSMRGGALLWRMPGRRVGGGGGACVPPAITLQPVSGSSPPPMVLTVAATGTEPLAYQWQSFSLLPPPGVWVNQAEDADFTGTQTPSMTIHLGGLADAQFRCVITNACGSVTSSVATVFT